MKELTKDLKSLKNLTPSLTKAELENRIDDFQKFQDEVLEFMSKVPCAGIAAPQFGENLPIFGIKDDKYGTEVVFSPTIKKYSKSLVNVNEGCLSFPGITTTTERSVGIDVNYFILKDGIFKPINTKIINFAAIVFQHETDHLSGTLMMDRSVTYFPSNLTEKTNQKLFQISSDKYGYDYFLEDENVLFFEGITINPSDFSDKKIAGFK